MANDEKYLIEDLESLSVDYIDPNTYLELMKYNPRLYTQKKYKKLLDEYYDAILQDVISASVIIINANDRNSATTLIDQINLLLVEIKAHPSYTNTNNFIQQITQTKSNLEQLWRCQRVKADGQQCNRRRQAGSNFCWQHQ